MNRTILHIDMDAFFASIEQRDNPQIKGRPVIVGGRSDRGVVAAASYEARKFGIHSAMPVFQARKKCPSVIIVPPRKNRYKAVSRQVMSVLTRYSPLVEPVSIDEAFVDITGCSRLFGSPVQIAGAVREDIRNAVHLTCSIGIAPNKFLAKIASDINKPDGIKRIEADEITEFIATLPIGRVPGVGKSKIKALTELDIRTLGDIRNCPEALLRKKFGKFGSRLKALSNGIDFSSVTPHSPVKSISSEQTLSGNTDNRELLKRHLLSQSEKVGREVRKKHLRAKTVSLKIKDCHFKLSTRSTTLTHPTQSSEKIFKEALRLFEAYPITRSIRLIGVGVSGLADENAPVQMNLFCRGKSAPRNWEKIDHAVDSITAKFGKYLVKKASLQNDDF